MLTFSATTHNRCWGKYCIEHQDICVACQVGFSRTLAIEERELKKLTDAYLYCANCIDENLRDFNLLNHSDIIKAVKKHKKKLGEDFFKACVHYVRGTKEFEPIYKMGMRKVKPKHQQKLRMFYKLYLTGVKTDTEVVYFILEH